MVSIRCNKTGSCKSCICVRNGTECLGFQPSKIGKCQNTKGEITQTPSPPSDPIPYVEVIHWSPNLFSIPTGTVGSAFVGELSRLFKAFAAASALSYLACCSKPSRQ